MFSAKASTLSNLQIIVSIAAVTGFWFFPFTMTNIAVSIIFFYLYNIVGVSITLHRYYSHKSFEFSFVFVKWLCTLISVFSLRGSPIGWAYIHRLHHPYADTEKDPHSPYNLGLKLFFLKDVEPHSSKMNIFMVKDMMSKEHLFINKYYFLLILMWLLLLAVINPSLIYFAWILPIAIVQFSQASFNYFAHTSGYRNKESKDKSTNNVFLWPFILGDAWHNNHHTNAGSFTTKEKIWEIDPAAWIIQLIKK
jgi:stearoyl-CoA desaturase (delta-9 desaturase)